MSDKPVNRRAFVSTAGLAGAAAVLSACGNESATANCADGVAAEPIEWKMVTAWPRDFPGLGTGAARLADYIGRLSGGQMTVKLFAGNELVPPLEVFDAVSRGTADMGHSASYYWKGKAPAAQFFGSVPFGLTAQEMNAWLYRGGGLELWREVYAPHGLVPFPAGNSGTQMGGWFNREIRSLADIKGLKMRIPGIGGEILRRAGGTPVTLPASEIYTALQTGTIDATEWVGPWNDLALGLFNAARYYYFPGWQEPGSALEAMVNKAAWDALPSHLQAAVEVACQAVTTDMCAEFTWHNAVALKQLREEHDVELRAFPDEVMAHFQQLTREYLDEQSAADPMFARVHASYRDCLDMLRPFSAVSEQYLMNLREPG
ncbi:TRAP transporter substrate-binding protein [Marinihelvus fidelis]|uniref:TRAP transporter substrate-binding protein n=1 Tax=Marinihelvus fidelis TaxID=2613842 RepID=A0A5N0T7X6_9GAMM|nr:TRAP transporter substrate-binding protein [Marinihelvus fidelis]KAA9131002.1 TRAP transporter substrate-binding protein [Marinihelvus fidelis]